MATTSGNLATGKALAGRSGKGRGLKGRVAGLVAAAGLGLGLLAGGLLMQGRESVRPAAPPDQRIDGNPAAAAVLTVERRRSLAMNTELPAEGFPAMDPTIDFGPVECGVVPCVSAPASGTIPATTSCAYADAAGVPGEGCTTPLATSGTASPCIHANALAVPGEGCGGYRLGAPNERDPEELVAAVAPTMPPVDASTTTAYRWAFAPAEADTARTLIDLLHVNM